MKIRRQAKILELIEKYNINTQTELSERLQADGFDVTQATVSRDIKELKLYKATDSNGNYKYLSAGANQNSPITSRFETIFKEAVQKVDFAGHLIVIKCHPGMGQAAGFAIDSMAWLEGIVGSIAGDDTVLLVIRDKENIEELISEFQKILK